MPESKSNDPAVNVSLTAKDLAEWLRVAGAAATGNVRQRYDAIEAILRAVADQESQGDPDFKSLASDVLFAGCQITLQRANLAQQWRCSLLGKDEDGDSAGVKGFGVTPNRALASAFFAWQKQQQKRPVAELEP